MTVSQPPACIVHNFHVGGEQCERRCHSTRNLLRSSKQQSVATAVKHAARHQKDHIPTEKAGTHQLSKKGPDGREDDRNGEKNQWKTEGGNLHLLNAVSTKRGHIQETSAK